MNLHQIIGRLGKDPEMRTLENGSKVCSFSVATSRAWKDKNGEKQEATDWHNIVFWGKIAEVCEKYLKKGDLVYISGESRTRSYEDKEGNKKYATELMGHNLEMLGGKKSGDSSANVESQNSAIAQSADTDDDLPF